MGKNIWKCGLGYDGSKFGGAEHHGAEQRGENNYSRSKVKW